jgi:GNAT superfamily N-acetyltransferase
MEQFDLMSIVIREGKKEDVPALLHLIRELAVYEKAPHEVEVTEEELLKDGFGEHPIYHLIVAEKGSEVIGIALYYYKYSTWKGRCLYLEDFVVAEEYRQKGVGTQLFKAVRVVAKREHVKRMEWQVLDWNEPAIQFYKKEAADLDGDWLNGRLVYDQLQGG